jgi:hypothetical protein
MNLSCQVQMMPTPPTVEPPAAMVAEFRALSIFRGQRESCQECASSKRAARCFKRYQSVEQKVQ